MKKLYASVFMALLGALTLALSVASAGDWWD